MSSDIHLFLCGDVMLARGVDMVQKYPGNPRLYEGNGLSANDYVRLAERRNGPIPPLEGRDPGYVWGDALEIWKEKKPDLRVVNLETSVTTSMKYCREKAIHYKMNPKNVDILTAAHIDCCVLSNNHTADWGFGGLEETLQTLETAGIALTGAGRTLTEAVRPAILTAGDKGRVLVYGVGHHSSGVPDDWRARADRCGLNVVELSTSDVVELASRIRSERGEQDIVVLSVHWGGNWGFEPEPGFVTWAHKVIDRAHVDVIHGHSSHHVMGMEVYKGKLIMYGCGDFVNDYEGIGGQEEYRGDLSLMYFLTVRPGSGLLQGVSMVPTQMHKFAVRRPCEDDVQWLFDTMQRECRRFDGDVKRKDEEFQLVWDN